MEEFKKQSRERKRTAEKAVAQWKKHEESGKSVVKNRRAQNKRLSASGVQEEIEGFAQRQMKSMQSNIGNALPKTAGRFAGMSATLHRDAVFIVRGIVALTGGKKSRMQAMMDSGKILPGEALAFQAAKSFLQTQATAAGIGLGEYLKGF